MKIYKAMSYKNILSKSLPKHLKDKNKIYFPIKNKIFAYSSQKNIKENNFINNLLDKLNKDSNDNIYNELKKSINIQSSNINIESYFDKNKILLSSNKNNSINKYFLNSKDDNLKVIKIYL